MAKRKEIRKEFVQRLKKKVSPPYLLSPEETILVIIDIQERLIPTMEPSSLRKMIGQIGLLTELATDLKIPILLTEQYPRGLGATIDSVESLLESKTVDRVQKTSFGCCGEPSFTEKLLSYHRRQVILAGMETHICVYLTALGLLKHGYQPFVAADAVIAHDIFYHQNGLSLMGNAGCVVTNTETLLFQLMGKSGTETFKKISGLLKESLAAGRR